ncbi:MAG: hypothetical protein EA409_00585 [Saprospirales bacterium]|nr:MAG: hypothetical protein EA409_00585 [Saprospirales bacterium]
MYSSNILLVFLLFFLAKTQASISQTYITPMVGYEWNFAGPYPNPTTWLQRDHNPKTRSSHTYLVGIFAKRSLSQTSYLSTGVIYSKFHYRMRIHPFLARNPKIDLKASRMRALVGLEYKLSENWVLCGHFSLNYLFDIKTWHDFWRSGSFDYFYPSNRIHLGIIVAANYFIGGFVMRPFVEWGFWNLKGHKQYLTSTTPISGFGLTIGYQFEL